MRTNNLLSTIICLTLCCFSCKKETSQKSTESNEQITKSSENNEAEPDDAFKAKPVLEKLTGTWKRVTYPYDEIIFNETEMKYAAGEGAAEAPKFVDYNISDECEFQSTKRMPIVSSDLYIVKPESQYCQAIAFKSEQLIYLLPNDSKIVFERQ